MKMRMKFISTLLILGLFSLMGCKENVEKFEESQKTYRKYDGNFQSIYKYPLYVFALNSCLEKVEDVEDIFRENQLSFDLMSNLRNITRAAVEYQERPDPNRAKFYNVYKRAIPRHVVPGLFKKFDDRYELDLLIKKSLLDNPTYKKLDDDPRYKGIEGYKIRKSFVPVFKVVFNNPFLTLILLNDKNIYDFMSMVSCSVIK